MYEEVPHRKVDRFCNFNHDFESVTGLTCSQKPAEMMMQYFIFIVSTNETIDRSCACAFSKVSKSCPDIPILRMIKGRICKGLLYLSP